VVIGEDFVLGTLVAAAFGTEDVGVELSALAALLDDRRRPEPGIGKTKRRRSVLWLGLPKVRVLGVIAETGERGASVGVVAMLVEIREMGVPCSSAAVA
jgi:hypothetical protein